MPDAGYLKICEIKLRVIIVLSITRLLKKHSKNRVGVFKHMFLSAK